jgi:chloramphenicol 3-O phosphotransferase
VTDIIVLNGGSSSGKSSLARSLQDLLAGPWVALGVDDLLGALAPSLVGDAPPLSGRPPLLSYGADGTVHVEAGWRAVEAAWYAGVVAMAKAGLGVILDEVLLDGGDGQRRLASVMEDLSVLWVGVRCDPAVAVEREKVRPGRVAGMAASQATMVHDGVVYDVVVDNHRHASREVRKGRAGSRTAGMSWGRWRYRSVRCGTAQPGNAR